MKHDSNPAPDFLSNHDWPGTIRDGVALAAENARFDIEVDERQVVWELLKEAVKTSALAYSAPPRTGYPAKSAMPDAPDDISYWSRMMAYIQGTLSEEPTDGSRPPMPSAAQISRAEVMLHIWHHHAIRRYGDRSKKKKALYMRAAGFPPRRITAVTGISRQALQRVKDEAMRDMWREMQKY